MYPVSSDSHNVILIKNIVPTHDSRRILEFAIRSIEQRLHDKLLNSNEPVAAQLIEIATRVFESKLDSRRRMAIEMFNRIYSENQHLFKGH